MTAAIVDWLERHALWLAVVAILSGLAGVEHIRAERLTDELTAAKAAADARFARQQAVYAEAAARAADAAASETARRIAAQEETAHEAQRQAEQARADALNAASAAERLRRRFAAVAAHSCGGNPADPAAAAGGPATADAAGVLAELQRRLDEAAGVFARVADERGIAGSACERAYTQLTGAKPGRE